MPFKDNYVIDTGGSTWSVPQNFDVRFNWDYDDGRAAMMGRYRQGVARRWAATTRLHWRREPDGGAEPKGRQRRCQVGGRSGRSHDHDRRGVGSRCV